MTLFQFEDYSIEVCMTIKQPLMFNVSFMDWLKLCFKF